VSVLRRMSRIAVQLLRVRHNQGNATSTTAGATKASEPQEREGRMRSSTRVSRKSAQKAIAILKRESALRSNENQAKIQQVIALLQERVK
jgi:hypothetical protein